VGHRRIKHRLPNDELSPPEPVVRTSNRRLLEDEFLVPLRLTRGRRSLRIRLTFDPVERPLLPDVPIPHQLGPRCAIWPIAGWNRCSIHRPSG
jgi:hypothetical protein